MNTIIIIRSIAQNHLEFENIYFILCSVYSTVTVSLNHTVIMSIIMIISVMIYRDMNFLVSTMTWFHIFYTLPLPISTHGTKY